MKKLALIPLILLAGCTTIKSLMSWDVAPFDGGEYDRINHLRSTAVLEQSHCGDVAYMRGVSKEIYDQSIELTLYSSSIPHNSDTVKMIKDLDTITNGFYERYVKNSTVSTAYCQDKLTIIENTTAIIQAAVANKPR
jgi:hypothetical protein